MGISHNLLKPSDNPLYGFGGKGTFPVGKIELPLSFGVAPNARSEQVTFDIVDMVYPYNAIMGRGSINKFEAVIHGLYLCMKIPGPQGVIMVYGNQQTARNIERDFVLGQRNVHCLTTHREISEVTHPTTDEKVKAQLQSNDSTKTVPLDPATPKQTVVISEYLTSQDEEKLIFCLSRKRTSSPGLPTTWSESVAQPSSTVWASTLRCAQKSSSCTKCPMKRRKPPKPKCTALKLFAQIKETDNLIYNVTYLCS
jgi:hypothetical protein